MSLQERTLVVKNFDPERTTNSLLKELCLQGGPVRNVVVKPDHAFVEYEDPESVGYSKALLDGVELFGRKLIMESKTKSASYFKYTQLLHDYIKYDKQRQQALQQQQQMMSHYSQQQAQSISLPVSQTMDQQYVNFVQAADPNIFNNFNQTQFLTQLPPYNNERSGNNHLRRSRSFNHRHQQRQNHSRNRSSRASDWVRRR